MQLRDKITSDPGFQYIIDSLNIISAAGRRALMDTPLLSSQKDIETEFDNMQAVLEVASNTDNNHAIAEIKHFLMCLHDSQGTVANLSHHSVIGEVELFEVKNIAYTAAAVSKSAVSLGLDNIFDLPELSDIFALLDPDNTGLPHFYIYDSYHPQLAEIRKQMKIEQANSDNPESATRYADLFSKHNEIQHLVETQLSQQLWDTAERLAIAVNRLAYIDILFAKVGLASAWNFVRPSISTNGSTIYKGLFNPRLLHRNQEQRLRYQPIDISISQGLCLITGANMAGKTVLLKTLGVAQLLAQFGMFVPAASASITLVDDIVFCIGDKQNEMNGLSSFASEIIKISNVVKQSATAKLLILIDEPARTTNPVEGKAIVQALSNLLAERISISLITTHYAQLGIPCRRLRIAGFREELANAAISPENINLFMDYSLVEDNSDTVPHEALRIATLLGCDTDLINLAEHHLNTATN